MARITSLDRIASDRIGSRETERRILRGASRIVHRSASKMIAQAAAALFGALRLAGSSLKQWPTGSGGSRRRAQQSALPSIRLLCRTVLAMRDHRLAGKARGRRLPSERLAAGSAISAEIETNERLLSFRSLSQGPRVCSGRPSRATLANRALRESREG